MANALQIAAVGWCLTITYWLLSPVFSLLWNKLFTYLASDTSRKVQELELHTIPSLKPKLRDVVQQRMEKTTKDQKGYEFDIATLEKIENNLKSALYEAEDILDLVDYYRIEKKVLGDRSWFRRCVQSIGAALLQCTKGVDAAVSWLWRCAESIGAAVLQCVKGHRSCGDQEQIIPASQSPSNLVLQRQRLWSDSLDVKALCLFMKSWIIKTHAGACFHRDWSYELVGIKSNETDDIAADSFLPVIEGRRLKKRIEQIDNIVSDLKKSHLLDEDSSNHEIHGKDTNKESGRTQEEIDDLHIGIKRKVFGRHKERKRVCKMLRKGSEAYGSKPYCVIGIYGITGSGKSTLAQYVCDHEKKAKDKYFNLIMFSHVSTNFRVVKIFVDMLEQITQEKPSDTVDLKILQQTLKTKLKEKRFLLVLDDLWVINNENQDGLDILLDALNAGKSGSKILVTAQREDAAATLGCLQEQISIPDLDYKDYLSLFMRHARPGAVNDNGEYRRIGSKIANKLHRSPIAAVTVGKQLRRNPRIDFWKATENNDVLNETMGALWWSYQQLGPDIRQCFAYCSTFPRGYKLERDQLVRIWIAQGFVNTSSDAKEEMEDVGKRYFDELLAFSFLQVQRPDLEGKLYFSFKTKKFTIHDLLHELAERVAGCDFHRIDLDWSPKDIPQGVRHVFIETKNVVEIAENNLDMGNLRTLIIKEHRTDTDRNHDLQKVFENLFMRMRKLRLLIVELNHKTEAFSVPASIDQMKHLRYFCFKYKLGSGSNRLTLPSTISKLYHMQTIKVGHYLCDVSCPEDMSNLIHLRHISAPLIFPNVGRLTSLQTLTHFQVRKKQGYELKQLKHLNKLWGTLSIDDLGNVRSKEEALEAHLTQKKRLTKLYLSFEFCWDRNPNVLAEVFEGLCPPEDLQVLAIWHYNCSLRYPSWMLSCQHPDAPKRLQTLELRWCSRLASIPEDIALFKGLLELRIGCCHWDSLPENMERLESLQTLIINSCDKMELLPTLPQSLQTLIINSCDKMELLPTLPQSLRTLIITSCNKMELIPMLPQSLRKIQICFCGVLSATCKEEGHENWHKIQHIPEKFIW